MADVLSFRLRQRPVRTAAATSTLVVSFFSCWPRWPAPVGLSRWCSG